MELLHDPQKKFYYMSRQSKDDVLIFKNFDSKKDVVLHVSCDHTCFTQSFFDSGRAIADYTIDAPFLHPHATGYRQARRIIEALAFIFTYPRVLPSHEAGQ